MTDRDPSSGDASFVEAGARAGLTDFQARYPLRSRTIQGSCWTFRRSAAGDGLSPILMLPGIQGGADVFYATVLALSDAAPFITINAPDLDRVDAMNAGLFGLLGAIGIARINLVGSSLGGYLAQSFAGRHPEMIDRLVIANGFNDPAPFVEKSPPVESFETADAADLVGKNLAPILQYDGDDDGRIRLKAVVQALVGPVQTLDNYKSRLLLMMRAPPLAAPTLAPERVTIIDDDHDPMLPPDMRNAVRRRFALSEHHAIDGGGHLPAIQRPIMFAELLRRRLVENAS